MKQKSNVSRLGEVVAYHCINPPDQDSDDSLFVFVYCARPTDIYLQTESASQITMHYGIRTMLSSLTQSDILCRRGAMRTFLITVPLSALLDYSRHAKAKSI